MDSCTICLPLNYSLTLGVKNLPLWSRRDSNPHPLPCKGNAQPIELQPHGAGRETRTHNPRLGRATL